MASKFAKLIKKQDAKNSNNRSQLNQKKSGAHIADESDVITQEPVLKTRPERLEANVMLDSISANMRDNKSIILPLESIVVEEQLRKIFTQDSIEELANNIEARGQIQPVVVRQIATNKYLLEAGERRYRAKILLRKRSPENFEHSLIRASISESIDHARGRLLIQFDENVHREDFTAEEEAVALFEIKKAHGDCSYSKLSELVHLSKATISRRLSLLTPDGDVLGAEQEPVSDDFSLRAEFAPPQGLSSHDSREPLISDGINTDESLARQNIHNKPAIREAKMPIPLKHVNKLVELLDVLATKHDLHEIEIRKKPSRKELLSIIDERLDEITEIVKDTQ